MVEKYKLLEICSSRRAVILSYMEAQLEGTYGTERNDAGQH